MTVVIGFSFPEEAIIISDSRISFIKGEVVVGSQDNLRKIFILTPQLAVGFAGDVKLAYLLISRLEDYIKNQAKVTVAYYLLQKLPKVVKHEYKKLTKNISNPPDIEFMYAGILADRQFHVPEPIIMDMITKSGGGAFPEPFGKALMTMRNGIMTMEPPTPVILKQHLPSGQVSDFGVYTVGAIGSGAPMQKLFGAEYSRILTCEPAPVGTFRSNYIRIMCDDFIKESGLPTVGGAVQVLSINAKGARAVESSFKRIFSDSKVQDISSMEFDGEKWIFKNYETNEVKVIKSFLPPKVNPE